MKYHNYRYSFDKWTKQKRWDPFKHYKKGQKYYDILPSLYYTNQTYGALNKCWVGFVIAKEKGEWDMLEMYAKRIQKLERHLGREITDFSNWGIN
jgi:1-acyl-sn-glycerol-3-phosphate acyltransferase